MQFNKKITTVDTHTEGGPTRTVIGGVPKLLGTSVKEKMNYFQRNHDSLRKLLMKEPRGHEGMFGSILTEPSNPKADIGVFFLTPSGYLNMCVHSAIGAAKCCLELGIIPKKESGKHIILETPAGLIKLLPNYESSILKSFILQSNPIFVHSHEKEIDIGLSHKIKAAIVFSAVWFLLVDLKQLNQKIVKDKVHELSELAKTIIDAANDQISIAHPQAPELNNFGLVMIYNELENNQAINMVLSPAGALDRSPCGAGTGAKITYLYTLGKIGMDENYINHGVYGTKFEGRVNKSIEVFNFPGAIVDVKGSAFITGFNDFILEELDPLQEGLG